MTILRRIIIIFLRLALVASFLSAVADRFGYWGAPGAQGVAWGNFENFIAYTATLNPFLPSAFIPTLAWTATIAEIVLAALLALGVMPRLVAFASGTLLLLFALAMTFTVGIKAPLDYSVFTASAAAFGLFCLQDEQKGFF